MEVAKALEGVKGDAVIDDELIALDEHGVSHFQLIQNSLRHKAKLQYCAFDLMFTMEKTCAALRCSSVKSESVRASGITYAGRHL